MSERHGNTREQLLDVAQELIQTHGVNAMSFQDLSDAVGIRKASVHYHFANKAEMVNALLHRFLKDFDEAVLEIVESRASAKTKLKRYCGLFQSTLEGDCRGNCLCGMLMAEILSLEEAESRLVRQFISTNVKHIRAILKEGAEDGSLSEQTDAVGTPDLVLAVLEGGLLLGRCDGGSDRFATVVVRLIRLLSPRT